MIASRLNYKIDRYIAWKPDPLAIAVDAFTVFWGNDFNYIFPPFSVIGQVLQKIDTDCAKAITIAPLSGADPGFVVRVGVSRRGVWGPRPQRVQGRALGVWGIRHLFERQF